MLGVGGKGEHMTLEPYRKRHTAGRGGRLWRMRIIAPVTAAVLAGGGLGIYALTSTAQAQASCPAGATVITGTQNHSLTISGPTCIENATVTGSVSVNPGASLTVINSTISGGVTGARTGAVTVCDSTVGSLSISQATGPVDVGAGAAGCGPVTINGGLTLNNNTGGVNVQGSQIGGSVTITNNVNTVTNFSNNTVGGALSCANNIPVPTSAGNFVAGAVSGQCEGTRSSPMPPPYVSPSPFTP